LRGIEVYVLSVVQRRERLIALGEKRDLDARMGFQFQKKTLAFARDGWGLDHAAAQDNDLATFGVQFRWRSGRVNH
jgi:hypothetical protein